MKSLFKSVNYVCNVPVPQHLQWSYEIFISVINILSGIFPYQLTIIIISIYTVVLRQRFSPTPTHPVGGARVTCHDGALHE
jgi:hypothetical protein